MLTQDFRKFMCHCNTLKRILNDTQRSLNEVAAKKLFPGGNLNEQLSGQNLQKIHEILDCAPALLVFGQNCHAKALFVNDLLDQVLLPLHSSTWRWVRILYNHSKRIRLTLGDEYEIVEQLKANEQTCDVIPEQDLLRHEDDVPFEHCPSIEIEINHDMLKENVKIIIPPDYHYMNLPEVLTKSLHKIWPVILYIIVDLVLTEQTIEEIRKLKEIFPDFPFLFIKKNSGNADNICNRTTELTESEQHHLEKTPNSNVYLHRRDCDTRNILHLKNQLERLGYINSYGNNQMSDRSSYWGECAVDSSFINEYEINDKLPVFVQGCLKSHLLKMSESLSQVHNECLRKFILSAFDMAREIQITPKRILYAQEREEELYRTLMNIASEKQEEMTKLIQNTLQDMRNNIAKVIQDCDQDIPQTVSTSEIQQLILKKLCNSVAKQLVSSVNCLENTFIGTLQRCLESLEKNCKEQDKNMKASVAVEQILSAAYKIDLKSSTSFSVVHTFWERLRNILYNLQLPWSTSSTSQLNPARRRQMATDMIDSLRAPKLARNISTQFREHVKASHEAFQTALRTLDNHLSGKLEQTEEQRIAIRKVHAPRLAKLALESTSMCDMVRWGIPKQIKEIGRGQYGVVFASEPWGHVNPCAVKSVVSPDERWNDLAMEFYYTRTLPEHVRIVRLHGSVIDQSYGGGCSAILLIMERMSRDLYCGLHIGLSWKKRLQIAIDVVEGIRYLHSQGLVHRDIKLKNVLLDTEDRAKLTDFGFCIPEAMMSGSVVGTPVHMAPELLSGHYDAKVDVYAFGILFWYICAGRVRLPRVFETFQNKEQLWTSVCKGIRPECLSQFDEACWSLMEQCWAAEPTSRPLLGDVQPQLETIMNRSCIMSNNVLKTQESSCIGISINSHV